MWGITNPTNWDVYQIVNSSDNTNFEVVDEIAKNDGEKSLKCIGVSSRTTEQVRLDMKNGTTDALLASHNLNQDNWGITTLAEVGGTTCQATIKLNVYAEMSRG